MLYRLVTLLSFLLGTVAVAEGQEPVGYWLYVDGAWKGAFVTRADCDEAAAKTTGKLPGCRALYPRPVAPREPLSTPTEKPKGQVIIPGSPPLRPDELPHYIYQINTGRLVTGPFKDNFECEAIGMRQLGRGRDRAHMPGGPYRCATGP